LYCQRFDLKLPNSRAPRFESLAFIPRDIESMTVLNVESAGELPERLLKQLSPAVDIVAGRDNRPIELYLFVAIVFLVICFSASRLAGQLRRKYAL